MELLAAYVFAKRFMAEATDGHLSDSERKVIMEHAARHASDLGLPMSAVDDAMDASEQTYDTLLVRKGPVAVVDRFRHCVTAIGAAMQDQLDALQRLHDELLRLVRADGVVVAMEQHFLDEVARAWLVQAATHGTGHAKENREELQAYIIAQIYLAQSSGAIVDDERRVMWHSLGHMARRMGIEEDALDAMVDAAQRQYLEAQDRGNAALHNLFLAALAQVRDHFAATPGILHEMADAMLHLASSDGHIDHTEASHLQDIAAAWQHLSTDPV